MDLFLQNFDSRYGGGEGRGAEEKMVPRKRYEYFCGYFWGYVGSPQSCIFFYFVISIITTLVNVYVDLVVFTRIAGTS